MKHIIMCSCGKLAIKCKEASEALDNIVIEGKREVIDEIKKGLRKEKFKFRHPKNRYERGWNDGLDMFKIPISEFIENTNKEE